MPNSITKSVIGIVAVAGTLAVGVGTIGSALAQSAVEQKPRRSDISPTGTK
jgi:hypothetical protein